MKRFAKFALSALLLAGSAAAVSTPAAARVVFGVGYGPGYYGPPPAAVCDPYSPWFDPYRCDYYDYYDGPVFIDGFWFNGPFRSRFYGGHREFWVNGGWHEGRYRDGGHFYRGGGDWHGSQGGGSWRGGGGYGWSGGHSGGGHGWSGGGHGWSGGGHRH